VINIAVNLFKSIPDFKIWLFVVPTVRLNGTETSETMIYAAITHLKVSTKRLIEMNTKITTLATDITESLSHLLTMSLKPLPQA
jgi:hypothetical protein